MRYLYWIYALAAFGLCVFLFVHVRRAESADPRALLEHARSSMTGPELDLIQAGHDLDSALGAAERAMDRPLIEEILIQRARLARQTNALARAKADLEHVLTHYRPNSPAIESMLASVLLDGGEVEAALVRAEAVLARDRNQSEAWGVKAEALLALADRHLVDCVKRAGVTVAPAGLADSEALMRKIAARPLADAARLRLAQELFERFPASEKELAREVQARLDDASALLTQAPEALAQSFRGGLRPKALTDYLRTLNDAGESEAAADLGLAALTLPQFVGHAPLLRLMLDVLRDAGRRDAVGELVDPKLVKRVALDSDFYAAWARTLLDSGDWELLLTAGHQLRASPRDEVRALGDWYICYSLVQQKRYAEGAPFLRRRVQAGGAEPFENATATCWIGLAGYHRAQGETEEESQALQRAAAAATPRWSELGDTWLRLAELELGKPTPNRGLAMDALTGALSAAPARRAELEPRWRELGDVMARARKLDFERECEALERENRLAPVDKRLPFEYVRLGELQFENGRFASALALAARALESHPQLAPALELASDAALRLEAWSQAARWLRELIEVEGPVARRVEQLANLPEDVLGADRRRELVRLDPAGIGRRWAAEDLRDRGELARAIEGLERVAPARRVDRDHRLLAELLFQAGRLDRAQAELSNLSADVDVLASAAPLMLSIAARQKNEAHALRVLRLLEVKVDLDLDAMIAAVDELLANGLVGAAAATCELLDSRPRWRTERAHLRQAQAALLRDDHAGAREALERALAYDEQGSAELGLILAAVQERRWGDCPALHRQLLDSAFQPTGLQFVALAAIGEQFEDARIVLEAEIAQRRSESGESSSSPLTPIEALLSSALETLARPLDPKLDALTREHGFGPLPTGAVQRDPRTLLARLAALDDPEWTAWAVSDLARQNVAAKGALWPTYLAARGAEWLETYALAEQLARALTKSSPGFGAAWDVLESAVAAQEPAPDSARVLEVLSARRTALGPRGLSTADSGLLDARLLRARGDLERAAQSAETAFTAATERVDVLEERARIAELRKQWAVAIESRRRALELAGDDADPASVRACVELLGKARAALGTPFDSALRREFAFLLEAFPLDPLVRLEATRQAYPLDSAADRWVAEHALSELESLRVRLEHGLEAAQPGAGLAWARFYAKLDPRRAFELVESELTPAPHSAELWSERGKLAAELGRFEEAVESLEVALGISPSHDSAAALVSACARRGDTEAQIQEQIARVAAVVGLPPNDRRFQLALARAQVRGSREKLGRGIPLLAQLWTARDAKNREAEMVEIGLLYGSALCRRGTPADAALALEVFTQVAPRVGETLQASLVATLRSLAAAQRARG
jgi:tetratricopeptide (TPR) repeat protein